LPLAPLFLVVGSIIGVIVFLTTHVDRVPKFHAVSTFLSSCADGILDRNFLSIYYYIQKYEKSVFDGLLIAKCVLRINNIADICIYRIFGCHVDNLFSGQRSHGSTPMHRILMQYI